MKQQLRTGIVLNLLLLSVLGNFNDLAYGTEHPIEFDLPATTIQEWQAQINNYLAIVTEIEVRSTIDGVDIILITADGEQLQGSTSTAGNNLIIDIPNAQLDLPEKKFVQENPVKGIASITVTTSGVNNLQVIITGMKETPVGEAITTPQGITISVIPVIPVADTATSDQVIDIIVTAEKTPEDI